MKKLEQKNCNDLLIENYEKEQDKILLEIRNITILKIQLISDRENSLINNIVDKIRYYEINYDRELEKLQEEENKLLSELEFLFDKKYKDKFMCEEESSQFELNENFFN